MTNPDGSVPDQIGGFGGPGVAVGLINAGAQIYDTYQSNKTAKENTNKTIAAQKAEAELAYQRSIEMWHMQNAYNSPQEQMKRFGAAGLNPHLIYGQGSAGNASSTPNYQAPNLQYRYAAPTYGGAVGSILPTLMSVGMWMQNMRQAEVDIQSKQTGIEKAQQLIDFLNQQNPRTIARLDNALSLYPYQKAMSDYSSQRVGWQVNDLIKEHEFKFGPNNSGGIRRLQFLQQDARTRLEQAKASFTDFNITNPQALMQLVMSGVMSMAGQQLRLSTHRSPAKFSPKKITNRFDSRGRRVYQRVE